MKDGKWILLLLFATAIWGSTFALVKDTLDSFPTFALLAVRFGIATALLAAYFALTKRKVSGYELKTGAFLGFFLFLGYFFQTWGLNYTSATNSAFVTSLFVLMVPFLSIYVLGKMPQRKIWLAVALALAGLYLLTGASLSFNVGDAATLLCAAAYGIQITYNAKYLKKADPINLVFMQIITVAAISFALALALGELPVQNYSAFSLGTLVFLALFATIGAHTIQLSAQKVIEPSKIALLLITEPLFAALFAALFFNESITGGQLLGAVLVLTGTFIAEYEKIRI